MPTEKTIESGQSSPDTSSSVTQKSSPQQLQHKDFTQLNLPIVVESNTFKPDIHGSPPCRVCGCDRTHIVIEKSSSAHYGAIRCAGCDCFQGWAPKPETLKRREDTQKQLQDLLDNPHLSRATWDFCMSLQAQLKRGKKLSNKQQAVLTKIAAEFGGAV